VRGTCEFCYRLDQPLIPEMMFRKQCYRCYDKYGFTRVPREPECRPVNLHRSVVAFEVALLCRFLIFVSSLLWRFPRWSIHNLINSLAMALEGWAVVLTWAIPDPWWLRMMTASAIRASSNRLSGEKKASLRVHLQVKCRPKVPGGDGAIAAPGASYQGSGETPNDNTAWLQLLRRAPSS